MGRYRGLLLLFLTPGLVIAVYLAMRGWAAPPVAEVKPVPEGSQEIAWIAPATGSDAWERLVAAAKLAQTQWGDDLVVSLDKAFLELTADVPEISFSLAKDPRSKLLIRWYKLSGDADARRWIGMFAARETPPLAVVGGDTSDRALTLAAILQESRGKWKGAAPLLLIPTATAERYFLGDAPASELDHSSWPKLMDVYPGRSFRFAFTNSRMVEAVLDFVRQTPQVCSAKTGDPAVLAGIVGQANPVGALGMLDATGYLESFFLYTIAWLDDGYSKDLAESFRTGFVAQARESGDQPVTKLDNGFVQYSVGEYYQPNPREDIAVDLFLATNDKFRDQHQLLVLPTAAQRARRFLRTLCRRAPMEVRNTVVLTGDAISFNNVYRDRNVAWNVQDLPVPLVFFSHRNPIDRSAGFARQEPGRDQPSTTSTHDLLLDSDILLAVLAASFGEGRLASTSEILLVRLRETRWRDGRIVNSGTPTDNDVLFFDAAGNRRPGTGEHVIWLRPAFDGNRNLPYAEISVWSVEGSGPNGGVGRGEWRLVASPLKVRYDRPTVE